MKHILLLLIALLSLPDTSAATDVYRVGFGPSLDVVTVHACFDGAPPRYLYRNAQAGRFSRPRGSSSRAERFELPPLQDNACFQWSVDLAAAAAAGDYRLALDLDDSIITSGDLWFWRDRDRRPIRLEIELPEGYSISAPWHSLGKDQEHWVFRPENTPVSWSSRIAVGQFTTQQLPAGNSFIRLSILGEVTADQNLKLSRWIEQAAASVAAVFGEFPQAEPQVLVVAIGPRSEAVPWAHVMRGGGVGAEFFVDPGRSKAELEQDWTAPHELSHMLLPYVAREDRWLSEGLASYYQNVLRARSGLLSELQAWQRLHAGFQRGEDAPQAGSLADASRSGRSSVMRVYWGGAALLLKADAQLRWASAGEQSLDSTLAALRQCCFNPAKRWSAKDLLQQMDRLTGFEVFSEVYEEHALEPEFPDIGDIYQQLGLLDDTGDLELANEAPWLHIRHAIMSATPPGIDADSGLLETGGSQ